MYNRKLIVCDVCDTLYKSNTTFDFIRFVVTNGPIFRLIALNLLTKKWSPVFLILVLLGKISGIDYGRKLAIGFFAGIKEDQLAQASEKFFNDFLVSRRNEVVFNLLSKYRNSNKLILASSSIQPIVQVIARANNFDDFIASKLECKYGRYTGALSLDLTGKKQSFVHEMMDREGIRELIVITDNKSDKELVSMANESFIAIKKESDKIFWKSVNANFIMVS